MTSLSVTNSFSSLEEQGRELFYPLSLKHEDYYCFSKNLHTNWPKCSYYDSLISVLFSIMKIVYCEFSAQSYSDFFEKCQGHKMKKKTVTKNGCMILVMPCFTLFFKEMGSERRWKERRNGNMWWEDEPSETNCSCSSITIHFSLHSASHLLPSACSWNCLK